MTTEYYLLERLSTLGDRSKYLLFSKASKVFIVGDYSEQFAAFIVTMGLMKRLWAPWRMKFVESKSSGCVFCSVYKEVDGPGNLIVFRGNKSFVILNRYPYTSGHLMVVAIGHLASFEDLDTETRAEMMELSTRGMQVLRSVYHPDAFNVGANIGAAAGAGVTGHVHLHVVPRWTGDSNFMMTLASTKVMPEALEDTYAQVYRAWQRLLTS
jgi:ATP adenylyltransferase